MPPKKDITGQVFGFLKAVKCTSEKQGGSYIWDFECTLCGKHTYNRIGQVTTGLVVSCGCFKNRNLTTIPTAHKLGLVEGTNISRLKSTKIQKNNTSGHVGVCYCHPLKKSPYWQSYIGFRGERYYLGNYSNVDDAIKAREDAEKNMHGEFLKWYFENYPQNDDAIKRL